MTSKESKVLEARLPCPVCPSSDGYHLYDDGHGYCYSCEYFKPNKEIVPFVTEEYTYEYLPIRGIEKNALKKYDVKTKIDKEGKPLEVGFKYPDGAYKIRSLSEKSFVWKKDGKYGHPTASTGLFGRDHFTPGSHKYVTITEGEYDALSLYQVLGSPVVSVQSSGTAARDCAVDRSFLNSFERVYLAFDNDEPGLNAARSVAKLFDFNKVYHVRFGGGCKDANEYVSAGRSEELKNAWWNSKKYLPETIISSLDEFNKILKEPMKKGIPYPFPTLSDMTYGIRTGESVLITAQEGVGKTELMHAIEYALLTETDSAVGAIFLEEPKRRHLQALAGIHLKKPAHLPDSGLSDEDISDALQKVVRHDDRLHIYSHFGSDDPEVILDTIRFLVTARACRYILFDHISMAVSGLAGDDERRALDYLSTRLETLVKELDFALIFVSHVNDFGQTRGSRYISKVADIRIDATRDLTSSDPSERNTTKLVVSKNRFCGRTGPAGSLIFDAGTYTLSEDLLAFANDNSLFEERKTA
jgi:twinkle protein